LPAGEAESRSLGDPIRGQQQTQSRVLGGTKWKGAGADIVDLVAPKPLLELGDPAGCEAPQVVDGVARGAERADRLPLEQVVRAGVGAGIGHTAERLGRTGDPRAV